MDVFTFLSFVIVAGVTVLLVVVSFVGGRAVGRLEANPRPLSQQEADRVDWQTLVYDPPTEELSTEGSS